LYDPGDVRRTLYDLLRDQYAEADRIQGLRGWGGAQSHGNDRYQYSLEQERQLTARLPGAQLLRPSQSLLYHIADARVRPVHYGVHGDDCPTSTRPDPDSAVQAQLAMGSLYETPTLFDLEPERPSKVVWLLQTGNHVESGPLSAYVALPGGLLPDGRIDWTHIEPLLDERQPGPDGSSGEAKPGPIAPEPTLHLTLRR
jgi:hypothetical protein